MGDKAPSPTYFIIRHDSTGSEDDPSRPPIRLVPLIPADVLPAWLEIKSFPHSLTGPQTVGLTSLGSFAPEGMAVVKLTTTPPEGTLPKTRRTPLPSAAGRFPNAPSLNEDQPGKGSNPGGRNKSLPELRAQTAKIDHQPGVLTPTSPTTVLPAKRRAEDAQKEVCKFLVNYGRCGFQNCQDKHVWPTTPARPAGFGLDRPTLQNPKGQGVPYQSCGEGEKQPGTESEKGEDASTEGSDKSSDDETG